MRGRNRKLNKLLVFGGMLTKNDLKQLRLLMQEEIGSNNTGLRQFIVENNEKLAAKVSHDVTTQVVAQVIGAVGELIEQNIIPQFNELHRELYDVKSVLSWQR